ncbi:MAG TPA: MMPL family transporter [Solirubrobacterales bacterium]|jgi:RND superfamily putative drug exporter|nr:MMPL family transporter [Solirubrobacterales bacterium]
MKDAMNRLAQFLGRRRRWVVAAWVLIVALALPFASKQTDHLTGGGFDTPGSQSMKVSEAVQEDFGSQADGIAVVLKAASGATAAERDAAIARVRNQVATLDDVTLPPAVAAGARRQLRKGSDVALIPLRSDLSSDELIDPAADLREDMSPGDAAGGVTPYLVGQPTIWAGMQEISKEDLAKAESSGFPLVALILLVAFGSLAAAALPLALGFVSVLVTGALIYFISLEVNTSVFVTNMASMIGIGVAVDYSLFILARYREERQGGREKGEARQRALSTSGLAVTFSGLAVIISLAGLWMVDNQALRSMALGAMTVVAVSILTATTLLPALIAMLGDRVLPGGIVGRVAAFFRRRFYRRRTAEQAAAEQNRFWRAWTARVMARPWTAIIAVSAVLLVLASPILSLQTGNEALRQFPADSDVRIGNELAAAQLGGGTDPIQIVASFERTPGAEDKAAVASFERQLQGARGLATVGAPTFVGDDVFFQATPRAPSESDAATAVVDRLRETIVPGSALAQRAEVNVGGETARNHDVNNQISGSMWKIVLFVLALSFVVLMVMLRSLILPLKAVLMNLLSIGAAFGILVAVFQWGWIDGFLGFESQGAVNTIDVPLIFAVVFGLSMDYEVFLMSRIRERYMAHGDNERAVAEGLSSSARTISSAALIMSAVFAVFVLTGVPSIKELGLGSAIAIALDATLVRLILVPAAMKLMGRWNWWMPSWLDRALPDLSFEGGGEEPEPAKA